MCGQWLFYANTTPPTTTVVCFFTFFFLMANDFTKPDIHAILVSFFFVATEKSTKNKPVTRQEKTTCDSRFKTLPRTYVSDIYNNISGWLVPYFCFVFRSTATKKESIAPIRHRGKMRATLNPSVHGVNIPGVQHGSRCDQAHNGLFCTPEISTKHGPTLKTSPLRRTRGCPFLE